MNEIKLREIDLKGYNSIAVKQSIPLGELTILLGPNGLGKSNLVSFFSMLNYMTTGAFQQYVGKYGVNRLLYYGSKKTESISFELRFQSDDIRNTYSVKLSHGLPDRLFISEEKVAYHKAGVQQSFVKELLAVHLAGFNVFADSRSVLTGRDKRAARGNTGVAC
ncbi:MAG: AAA family ATPase [Bacillota bacterium]|nr:AAA family ATPase [Bacillota bacterium]